jgi:aspartyl protease family protein
VTFPFNPARGLIYLEAEVAGPAKNVVLRLALDTGATGTLIRMDPLRMAGYDPTTLGKPVQATTISGVVTTFRFPVSSLTALGQTRTNFAVAARDLPPTSSVDGVLGLDFLRGNVLTLDFIKGEITLFPGTPAGPTP